MRTVPSPIKGLNGANYAPELEKSLRRSRRIKNGAVRHMRQMATMMRLVEQR